MTLYCSYPDYTVYGGSMPDAQYELYGQRASRYIDKLTLGRAEAALEAHPEDLKIPLADACAQIADLLLQGKKARAAAAEGISSANTDGYSESYTGAAGADLSLSKACRSVLADALGADPYGLLYAGVG